MSIITVALPLSAGLMTMSFRSIENFSFLLGQVIRNFQSLVSSIFFGDKMYEKVWSGSMFLFRVHVLLRLNGLSSSGL